jgi:type I restriction enzyme S subunit
VDLFCRNSFPDDWTNVLLREVCASRREHVNPANADAKVYVGLEHIQPGKPVMKSHGAPSEVQSAKSRFRSGDLLYGKLRPYLDKAVLADRDGICSTDILVLTPAAAKCDAGYLINVLHTPRFIQNAVRTTHGVNHPRTSWEAIGDYAFPMPPLGEQRAIGAVLGRLQAAMAAQQEIIDCAAELKSALMAKLFTEGTRGEPLKSSEIGPIPRTWRLTSLGSAYARMNYGTSARCAEKASGTPVLRIPNIIGERIDMGELKYAELPAKEEARLLLDRGDLLFIRTNGNRLYTGRSAVYEGTPERCLFASYLIRVRLSPESKLLPQFVQAFLSSVGRAQITSRANSASDGKWNIDTGILRDVMLPVPGENEQREILDAIGAVDSRRQTAERSTNAFRELFAAMLDELMSGRLRVNELDPVELGVSLDA